jgi:hypothetical protein
MEVPIFVNPSIKEYKEVDTNIRFIIDVDNKKVYIWSGGLMLHDTAIKKLRKEKIIPNNYILGESINKNIHNLTFRCKNKVKKELSHNLFWLEQYFDNIEMYFR